MDIARQELSERITAHVTKEGVVTLYYYGVYRIALHDLEQEALRKLLEERKKQSEEK